MTSDDILFQSPGPTNIPSRVLDALRRPAIDYHSKEFREVFEACQKGIREVLRTRAPVVLYPATGHGAWEAALVNVFSPGDRVLSLDCGLFGAGWADYARSFGLDVQILKGDPHSGLDYTRLAETLAADSKHRIAGVMMTHCETATGTMTDCKRVREAIDAAEHPALLVVDAISSLGCVDFRMDEWRADVVAGGSQKGLMMVTGLSFTGVSDRARAASKRARLPRAYWDWGRALKDDIQIRMAGTAPVQMFFGLQAGLELIFEEGLEEVLLRHARTARAVRAAVQRWAEGGAISSFVTDAVASASVTAIGMSAGHGADAVRDTALSTHKVQLGGGLGELADKIFRIGHMGRLSSAQTMGVLAAVEISLRARGHRIGSGALDAAAREVAF